MYRLFLYVIRNLTCHLPMKKDIPSPTDIKTAIPFDIYLGNNGYEL
jgi:hypothetical protein